MMKSRLFVLFFILLSCWPQPGWPWQPQLKSQSYIARQRLPVLVGENQFYVLGEGETLAELAVHFGVAYQLLRQGNPDTDPWLPEPGTTLTVPYARIIPGKIKRGITINLSEFTLYYLWLDQQQWRVRYYPIGIGRDGAETPVGDFAVTFRIKDPVWTVPQTLRAAEPYHPAVVMPGTSNPLGSYWIGLTLPGYGIHGTNQPFGVGRQVSHGCIRLYAEDIEDLFDRVQRGTPVHIIRQPVKVAVRDGVLYAEIHPDRCLDSQAVEDEVRRLLQEIRWHDKVDEARLVEAIEQARGLPVPVSSCK